MSNIELLQGSSVDAEVDAIVNAANVFIQICGCQKWSF